MKNSVLFIYAAITGSVLFALELAGIRLLSPYYGNTIFLWSSLLSITLAALSLGSLTGGKIADKEVSYSKMSIPILLAGIWIFLIPWLKHLLLSSIEPLGLRPAVLLVGVTMFFPPFLLLGMIIPMATKYKTASMESIGRSAGVINGIFILAGVISVLFTGYFLIPNFGVSSLILSLGILLLVSSIPGFVFGRKMRAAFLNGLLIVLSAISTFWFHSATGTNRSSNVLALKTSLYASLCVIDIAEQRHLFIDGEISARVDTSIGESVMPYCAVMELPKIFFKKPGTVLIIGLGGGSLVKQYRHHGWKVSAVERDHEVVQLAKQYFALYPSDGTIFETDGRVFLHSTSNTYDVILIDVITSNASLLYTREAFQLMSSRLTTQGVLAVNIEAISWYDPIVSTYAATLKSVFRDVLVLPIEEPPSKLGNLVLIASNSILDPKRIPQDNIILSPDWRYGPGYQKVHAWDNRFFPDIHNTKIQTDESNSLDIQWERVNQAARQQLHEYIAQNKVSGIW